PGLATNGTVDTTVPAALTESRCVAELTESGVIATAGWPGRGTHGCPPAASALQSGSRREIDVLPANGRDASHAATRAATIVRRIPPNAATWRFDIVGSVDILNSADILDSGDAFDSVEGATGSVMLGDDGRARGSRTDAITRAGGTCASADRPA